MRTTQLLELRRVPAESVIVRTSRLRGEQRGVALRVWKSVASEHKQTFGIGLLSANFAPPSPPRSKDQVHVCLRAASRWDCGILLLVVLGSARQVACPIRARVVNMQLYTRTTLTHDRRHAVRREKRRFASTGRRLDDTMPHRRRIPEVTWEHYA